MRYRPFKVIIAIALLMLAATGANAHVFLDRASPKVGSECSSSPAEVKVWFTGEVEAAFSAVEVWDSDGKQVDKQDCHVDPKDSAALIVSLPPLPPGTYKVRWHAVSSDTHKTEGDFRFVVKG